MDDSFLAACIDMAQRCGAREWQIRYSDDSEPVLWLAYCLCRTEDSPQMVAQVAGGMSAEDAAFRLCERLVDGGLCTHCGKPSGLLEVEDTGPLTDVLSRAICWYRYSAPMKRFRPACRADLAPVS
jgi:hypothetical protein